MIDQAWINSKANEWIASGVERGNSVHDIADLLNFVELYNPQGEPWSESTLTTHINNMNTQH